MDVRTLSQGTLDQFYLAARLALVRQVTQLKNPPLVFDDPFITFDDARARQALGLLKAMARDHQVIYLTCSSRYDAVADVVLQLPGPSLRDDAPPPATVGDRPGFGAGIAARPSESTPVRRQAAPAAPGQMPLLGDQAPLDVPDAADLAAAAAVAAATARSTAAPSPDRWLPAGTDVDRPMGMRGCTRIADGAAT